MTRRRLLRPRSLNPTVPVRSDRAAGTGEIHDARRAERMTIESENLGNGVIKPERLGVKYRGARRDGAVPEQVSPGAEPARSDDGDERHAHDPLDLSGEPITGDGLTELGLGVGGSPVLPSLDLGGLTEPVFSPERWPEPVDESLVEHPLLRGLLLELPPRHITPAPEWLDRWFEATRAILELLYAQPVSRPR